VCARANYLLDCLAVPVAGVEIHRGINARGVASQDRLDPADPIEEILPGYVLDRRQGGNRARDRLGGVMGLAIGGPGRRLEGRIECRFKLGERGDEGLQTGEAQHGRERPQLGNRERRLLLIGVDESHCGGEAELHMGGVEHAVRQEENARHPLAFGCGEAWQAAVESGRHVLADLPDGPAHMVVVVEKPLRRLGGIRWRIGAAAARTV
jgi:hypothetical protein